MVTFNGFPCSSVTGFNPWVGKIPWRRKWQPTLVLLPGKFHGQKSLVGSNPWGRKESDPTERLHFHFSLSHFQGFYLQEPHQVPHQESQPGMTPTGLGRDPKEMNHLQIYSENFHDKTYTPPLQVEKILHTPPPPGEQYFSHSRPLYFPEWPEGRGKVRNVCEGHGPRTEAQ